jgi:hypothetical protein
VSFDREGWDRACADYAAMIDPRRRSNRMRGRIGELRAPLVAVLAITLVAVPLATAQSGGGDGPPVATEARTGDPLREGRRNPARGDATRETELIARIGASEGGGGAGKGGFALRESNLSASGGGAVHGCRATRGNIETAGFNAGQRNTKPCLRASNLSTGAEGGRAFEFAFGGPVGGLIEHAEGGDGISPFSTNATGVAVGLNADRVDGRHGTDLLGRTEKAADSDLLDGIDSTGFLRSNQQATDSALLQGKSAQDIVMWGRFAANGTLEAGFGATQGQRINPGNYRAEFGRDMTNCSFQATPSNVNQNLTAHAALDVTNNQRVFVSLRNAEDAVRTDGTYQVAVHC